MPLTNREVFQLGCLLLCVPLQLYLSNYGNDYNEKTNIILNIVKGVLNFKDTCYNLISRPWKHHWLRFLSWFVINILGINENEAEEESPAVEVFEYRKKLGLQKKSTTIRSERPKEVWYRVGQVVENISEGYKGVIIDWFIQDGTNQPIYSLLLDERDKVSVKTVVEVRQDKVYLLKKTQILCIKVLYLSCIGFNIFFELILKMDSREKFEPPTKPRNPVDYVEFGIKLELIRHIVKVEDLAAVVRQVKNAHLKNYFISYDGAQYIPQPWLHELYPKD